MPNIVSIDVVIRSNENLFFDELLINALSDKKDLTIISEFGLTINKIKNLKEDTLGVFRKKSNKVVFTLIKKEMFKVSDPENLWVIYQKVLPMNTKDNK